MIFTVNLANILEIDDFGGVSIYTPAVLVQLETLEALGIVYKLNIIPDKITYVMKDGYIIAEGDDNTITLWDGFYEIFE